MGYHEFKVAVCVEGQALDNVCGWQVYGKVNDKWRQVRYEPNPDYAPVYYDINEDWPSCPHCQHVLVGFFESRG